MIAARCASEYQREQADRARRDRNRQFLLAALVAVTILAVCA